MWRVLLIRDILDGNQSESPRWRRVEFGRVVNGWDASLKEGVHTRCRQVLKVIIFILVCNDGE